MKTKPNLINNIKNNKIFVKKDLILYGLVVLFSFILVFFIFFSKIDTATGVDLSVDGKKLCTVNYDNGLIKFFDTTLSYDYSKTSTSYLINVYHTQDKSEYTKIEINFEEDFALVSESTCKNGTCEHSGKIYNTGAIICMPYKLKISPTDADNIVIGG